MQRDPRLQGLSEEHQHSLALAQNARWAAGRERGLEPETTWREVLAAYEAELAKHFEVEERLLLPALRKADQGELVERTLGDHSSLRAILQEDTGDLQDRLLRFGETLHNHIRFEEREMFPVCEEVLPGDILDAVAKAAPKLPESRG